MLTPGGASGASPTMVAAEAWHPQRAESEPGNEARSFDVPPSVWERMIEGIDADQYAVRAAVVDGAAVYEASNPAHGLLALFAEDGVRVRSARHASGVWEWNLELETLGYESNLAPVEEAAPIAEGRRVEYRRGELTEWYVNERAGLEQGFTVARAPAAGQASEEPLVLQLRASGLEIRQDVAGESILLTSGDGAVALHYRGLIAWDSVGRRLPASMWASDERIRIEVDDAAATYPVTIDPFIEGTVLRASDAGWYDYFGASVAVSGDTAIVGAFYEDGGPGNPRPGAGAAYIFERDHGGAGNWGETRKIIASDAQADDRFGYSVAISGDVVIVGAINEDGGAGDPRPGAGAAYFFERDRGGPGNWGEVVKVVASDAQADDRFGHSVSISGDHAIVGAWAEQGGPGDPRFWAGASYIFARNQGGPGNWGEVKKLIASDAKGYDYFGSSVSISGGTAIVGAYGEDGGPGDPNTMGGAAYIFERGYGGLDNWGEIRKLMPWDAQAGDYFGASVAISGDKAVVGAPYEDGGPWDPRPDAGAAYIFRRDLPGPNGWGQTKKLMTSDSQTGDQFGEAVGIFGDRFLGAALFEDGGLGDPRVDSGAAYLFALNHGGAGNWGEVRKLVASESQQGDLFGVSLAISGDTAIVGASGEDGGPGDPLFTAGAAYVFERRTWALVLDFYGGLHVAGPGALPISPAPPYFGFDIARDAETEGDGAYVLDGLGGIHAAGGVPPLTPGPPYFGFDVARDFELSARGGAYLLDGYGGVHSFGGAWAVSGTPIYFGFDAVRDMELSGNGYYLLDYFGGLHAASGARPIFPAPPLFGFDIAKDFELASRDAGYVLDGFGGVHAMGGAPVLSPAAPYFGFDAAVDLELADVGYYVLDMLGGVHCGGGATAILPASTYFFFDAARDLELR